MNRKIGFDNRLCYQREVARCQKIHHDKLRHMQPTSLSPAKGQLDNTAPQTHAHLRANLKKAQMDMDKNKQIYGENQQLMRKMIKICDTIPSDTAVEFRPGMRLNTDQTPVIDSYMSMQSLSRGCAKGSMNGEFRQREHNRIEDENRKMLQRILAKKSCYSARKWDNDYKQSIDKFKHVHQDATVGYLSPKHHKPKLKSDGDMLPSLASPRTDDPELLMTAPDPFPQTIQQPIKPPSEQLGQERAATASCTQRSSAFIRQASKSSQLTSRKQSYRTKCIPVLLLEATTSLGATFTIEELQIARVTPSATQLGDQGLLVRAKKDDKEGECIVHLKGLKDIASSLGGADAIAILSKLETIEVVPSVGNFPRLTQGIGEGDLKLLLVKLVQSIRVKAQEGAGLSVTLDYLTKDLHPVAKAPASSIIDVFVRGEAPPRFVLRGKTATIYLCHVRVYELRRLLTFHGFELRSHNVINYQFSETELVAHFHEIPLWMDIYRILLKLALKRTRI
ncbi:hypothetical protein AeMF1_020401 [Aphanomyces euteiches]|nr:hypothetical protein AeMF1_020401 [Aphanomyces euteiches]KAH9181043.1 hypothetical protein AeNC1_016981 [Aphanomyces euteiches]